MNLRLLYFSVSPSDSVKGYERHQEPSFDAARSRVTDLVEGEDGKLTPVFKAGCSIEVQLLDTDAKEAHSLFHDDKGFTFSEGVKAEETRSRFETKAKGARG